MAQSFFSWIALVTPIIFPVMFMLLAYRFALLGLLASQSALIAQTSVKSFGPFDQPPTESSLLLTQVQPPPKIQTPEDGQKNLTPASESGKQTQMDRGKDLFLKNCFIC